MVFGGVFLVGFFFSLVVFCQVCCCCCCFVCGFFELAVEYPCLNQREIKKGRALSAQLCLCIVHWGEIFHHMLHSHLLKELSYLLHLLWICFK